jgi:hypothetical protein
MTRLRVSPLRADNPNLEPGGDVLRDEGMVAVLVATDEEWKVAAERRLDDLARSGERFTSEDLTRVVGVPPSPNAVGAIVNAAARRGVIRPVGFTNATRPSQHSATLRVWEGVR